jgi:hypothetical protein
MDNLDTKAVQHITIVNHYYYYGKCCDKCLCISDKASTPIHQQTIFTTTGSDPINQEKIPNLVKPKSNDVGNDFYNPLLKFFPNLSADNTDTPRENPKKNFSRFQSEKYIKKPYNNNTNI